MKNRYSMSAFLYFIQKSFSNCTNYKFPTPKRLSFIFLIAISLYGSQVDAQCVTCTNNKIVNGGFDTNVTGWTSANCNFTSSNPYPQCSTPKHALCQHTSGTASFYQDVTGITAASSLDLTFWAGVHDNSFNAQFGFEFYNGTTLISQNKLQIDKILGGTPSMQLYAINTILPANCNKVRVIGTTTGDWLKVDEVCLMATNPCINVSAFAQSEVNLVKTRTVTDEVNCNNGAPNRVFWSDCLLDNSPGGTSGNLKYWKIISGGTFKEYCDGTAYLEMRVQNVVNSNYKLDIIIYFSGRIFTAPSGSPHITGCTTASTSNWYYYTAMKGSLVGVDGLTGGVLSFDRKMASFQLGTNASLFGTSGIFGASGWLDYTVLSQPSAFNFPASCDSDLNFFLSGGNLTALEAATCNQACGGLQTTLTGYAVGGRPNYTYNWSGGLGTGQTKIVTPAATTTYTVTITDAQGCTAIDAVVVNVKDCCSSFLPAISGSSALCSDNLAPTTLTVTGGAASYLWSTGATTSSITISPNVTTTYTVTVTSVDGCIKTVTKTVSVIPCTGQICFNGANGVSATTNWTVYYTLDPVNDKVKVRATLSKNFVDNTYGTNAIDWPKGHTFSQLVGSDHLQLSLLDGSNVKKMEFKMDYLTASAAAPSGYKSLGVTGGDGQMILGSSSDVLSVVTSLDVNFNQYGYVLTTNSPATNSTYTPNPSYPNWIYDVWYEVEVKLSAFGTAGFGKVGITGVHASPSKTGNNTEIVTEGPCCELFANIAGNTSVCSGKSTTLTASYQSTLTSYLNVSSDTYLSQVNATKNFGACNVLTIGSKSASDRSRAVLLYNLSSIPAGATITSAYLTLTKTGGSNTAADFAVHRVTAPWDGGTGACAGANASSNWNQRQGTTAWSTAGGDFNATAESVVSVGNNADYTWDVKNLVQGWRNGSITNNGLLVKMVTEGGNNEKTFASFEDGTASRRPMLAVTYLVTPVGGNSNYVWSNGATTSAITVSPTSNTTYTVTVSETGGCTGIKEVDVTVNPKPTLAAGDDIEICTGTPPFIITVSASGGTSPYTYNWSNGGTGNSQTVQPAVNTTYIITVTDNKGCTGTDDVRVSLIPGAIVDVGPDINLCNLDEEIINSVVTNIPLCGTPGINKCNHILQGTTGWVDSPSASTICGDNAGTKLWTRSGNGTSSLTLDFGTVVPTGTTICVRMKLEHCSNTTSTVSDAKIQRSTAAASGYVDVIASKTFSSTSYIEYCYVLTGATRYVKVIDNGKCAFRVDYIKFMTPDTYNNSIDYFWSGPGIVGSVNGPSIIINKGGTYVLVVTDCNGCTSSDAAIVTINNGVTADAGPNQVICSQQSATLTANLVTGATYEWRSSADGSIIGTTRTITVSPTETTSYIVKVIKNGCDASAAVTVTVNPKPSISASALPQTICSGLTSQLTANGSGGTSPYTYVWNNGLGVGNSKTVNPLANTTYIVTVTDASGCTASTSTSVNVNTSPALTLTAVPEAICIGSTSRITATAVGGIMPYNYSWSNGLGSGASNFRDVSPVLATTYTVTVSDGNGCTATSAKTVTVNQLPVAAASNDGPLTCIKTSVSVTANPATGVSYLWNNGATTRTITTSTQATFTVTVTDINTGCSKTANSTVSGDTQVPTVDAGPDKIICKGESVVLTATGSGNFVWNTGATTASITVSPQVTTTYTVTTSLTNGCTASAQVQVTVNSLPNNSGISGPAEICVDDFAQFSVSPPLPGATYTWNFDGGVTASGNVNGITESVKWSSLFKNTFRNVTLTITLNNCTFNYSKQIYIKSGVILSTGDNYPVCQGGSVTIGPNPNDPAQVSSGATFLWTPNLFLNSNTVAQPISSPPFDITYTLTVTLNGCIQTKQVTVDVDVNLNPVADAGPDRFTCLGEPIVIGGNPTATPPPGGAILGVVWSPVTGLNNNLLPNPTANPNSDKTYRVIVVATSGCSDTAFMNLTVLPKPSVNVTATPQSICSGESTTLSATGTGGTAPYSFTWSDGLGAGNNKLVSPSVTKTYTVTITDSKGCSATGTVTVNVNQKPTVGVNASPASICLNTSSTLTATGSGGTTPYTFTWSNGLGSGNQKSVSPLLTTTYTVTISDNNGCTSSTSVAVTVYPKPSVTLEADPTSICVNESTIIFASGNGGTLPYTFNWSNGLGTGLQKTVSPILSTTYTVTVFDGNGCTSTASITITVNPRPTLTATATPSTICDGESSVISASASGGTSPYTYNWSNNLGAGSSKTVNPAVSGTYTVTVIDSKGCSATKTVSVTVEPKAKVGNFVWEDKNANGLQDAGEPGIGGVPVKLYNASTNVLVDQTLTSTSGLYEFVVCKGTYYIEFGTYLNYIRTFAKVGNDDTIDSDANTSTGKTSNFTLNPGDINNNIDAGYYRLAAIGDFVWLDGNKNGIQDLNEPGIPNITLSITGILANGTLVPPAVTITNLQGYYLFSNLIPGKYTITVSKPDQYNFSPANQGGDITKDSDANPLSGVMSEATLSSGETNLTYDAGLYPSINIDLKKNFISAVPQANGTFLVKYNINVNNTGGSGQYTLKDIPGFDDDVIIQSSSFVSNAPGNAGGTLSGTGPWTLASNLNINGNTLHSYIMSIIVKLNLKDAIGNNIYTPCGYQTQTPVPGQGLYNKSTVDTNDDGIPEAQSYDCGDIEDIDMRKDIVSVTPNANGSYNVTYSIIVTNKGGASGKYTLKDTPLFDNDVLINSGSFSGQANGTMNTSGSTTLATNTIIAAGATHTYNVTFNVRLSLSSGPSGSGGDNVYTPCAVPGNGPGSGPGQGLYNKAELDWTGDGITDITDDACGDIPNINMHKDFVGVVTNSNGTFNVTYAIVVNNNGGATGSYTLKDTPLFDNDVIILSGTYNGQANGAMNTTGSTTLGTNVSIAAGATQIYTVTFNVRLDLAPGSPDGGDNIYTPCAVPGNGPGSNNGQGLYNKAELDYTGDGITDITDDACGDLPNITMRKDFVNVVTNANGTYNVTYAIIVNNNGGAVGKYSLKDTPLFDNDVTILSGTYSGQANGAINISGSTNLASNVNINAGATHTYNLTFNVKLDLAPGSPDPGDNIYTACAVPGNGPGSNSGQGLYNKAELDWTGDGITDITDDACGDLPNITMRKDFVGVLTNANGTFNVTYAIIVNNNGGAIGKYSLKDTPLFDNDVVILSGTFSGQANGAMNISGSTNLGSNVNINAGSSHIYTVTFNVKMDLTPGSPGPGDKIYTSCAVSGNGPGSNSGQGLYNKAELDWTGDGITDITDDACGDIPNITMRKDFDAVTPLADGTFNVRYQIIVNNKGGASGQYTLLDRPLFDNDVTILAWDYTFVDVNAGIGNGPSFVGAPPVPINLGTKTLTAGNTHIYTISFNVKLDLTPGSPDPGDNIYTPCAVPGNGPGSNIGQGLYNKAELDWTGDGITDITDDACGDLPNVTMRKDFVNVVTNANGTYNVTYAIIVNNNGGATGKYSLKDTPLFDNDVTILSGTYSGQANGAMNISGSTNLASNVNINAGATHVYNVTFTVKLDLAPGSPDPGDNIYTPCAVPGNGPGSNSGQGLYNKAELDRTGDGITDITDDACGDLPNITMHKDFVSVAPGANGSFNVIYNIVVNNNGGAVGKYSLKDTPLFDNDVTILSGTFSGQANGAMNTTGSTTLGSNVTIAAGATHTYNVMFNVVIDLAPGSLDGGDNIYTPCAVVGNGPGSNSGQGLYNKAELDWTGDGITDISDDACGDLPGSIGDFVWDDLNANGLQDAGEPGIPNVVVRLFNQANVQIAFKLTSATGYYLFNNLAPGIYTVKFDKPNGYEPTPALKGDVTKDSDANIATGITAPIVLGSGENNLTIDAGFYKLGKIGDFVWEDRNINGIQDPLEPGIPNVTVLLKGTDALGNVVNRSTTTNSSGLYEFTNLVPGSYTVTFIKPGTNYKPSPLNATLDNAKDSDANLVTGETGVIQLKSGDINLTIDAGFYRCAHVGDYVWLDMGPIPDIQDAGDVGLNGILVELYSALNPLLPIQSMLTIDNPNESGKKGYYNFEVCATGMYFIKVKKPDGLYFVTPNQGLDDNIDSDIVDFLNQSTLTFTVTYAAQIDDIDIGLRGPLPVELLDFAGWWNQSKDVNELSWITFSEVNNDYFEVQRSVKGSAFEIVGKVKGKGNSNTKISYTFEDVNITFNGVYTYRLRQVDADGKQTYSASVEVSVERKIGNGSRVWPNPSSDDVFVEIQSPDGSKITADMYDSAGKLVHSHIVNRVSEGELITARLSKDTLKRGLYYIVVNIDGKISTHKLIILE